MKWYSGKRAPLGELCVMLVLFVLPAVLAAGVKPAQADPTCGLKIEIGVPDDVVRPQSTVLLKLQLTNAGHEELWLPSGSPDFWSYEFDLRDAQGSPVPRTPEWIHAISQRPEIVTLNVSMPLAPGASLTKTVMLERLFDLRKPGRYTLRVSFACGNTGTRLTSNWIQFTVPSHSDQTSSSHAGISVVISATRANVPVGWAAPMQIVVKNNSGHPLKWAADDPPNTAPDEFLSGVEVFDAAGNVCSTPKQPNPNWSFSRFRDTVSMLEIPPGESSEQIILVGDLFDISKPGKYRAQIALLDPISIQRVESNLVSFEVEGTASSRTLPKQPPFIVSLQSAHFVPPAPSDILICMSNISDHDIHLDNSALKDFVSVQASDGTTVAMTKAALKDWSVEYRKQVLVGLEQCCTWNTVRPRKALCGGLTVGKIYDLSKAGAYRIRVDRYDEPDATPGQKLGDLPTVRSNWLTIFENPSAASEEYSQTP